MADLVLNLGANDKASAVIKQVGENAKAEAAKMLQSNKAIGESTKQASRAKQEALTLSQKTRFAIAKEAAAGDKLKLSLVNRRIELAKMERKVRAAIKAGDENTSALVKQTVALRKNVKALEEKQKKQAAGKISRKGFLKGLAAVTAGAGVAAAAIAALTNKFGHYGDQMIKGAQRLTLTTDQFQKLDFAMKISGTSMDQQKASLVRFARTARDAATGVRVAEESFHRLGISAKDSQGNYKGMNQLLMEVSDSFSNMPDSVEKTAISMDLFGRSGSELAQFLNLGSAGLVDLGDELTSMSGIMSMDAAKSAEEYVDALTRLGVAFSATGRGVAEETMPIFTRTMNQIAKSFGNLKESYQPVFQNMVTFIGNAAKLLVPIGIAIGKIFIGVMVAVKTAWDGLLLMINGVLSFLPAAFNKMVGFINRFRSESNKIEEIPNIFLDTMKDTAEGTVEFGIAAAATFEEMDKVGQALLGNTRVREEEATPAIKKQTKELKKQLTTLRDIREEKRKAAQEEADRKREEKKKRKDAEKAQTKADKKAEKEKTAKEKQDIADADAYVKRWGDSAKSMGDSFAEEFMRAENAQDIFLSAFRQATSKILDMVRDAAITEILADSGAAAVKAGKSQAGLPVVGPYLAAVAAATMFGIMSAYVSKIGEKKMNTGGIVPGMGSRDSVRALLTPGELVVPKDVTKRLFGLMSGETGPEFAQGGIARGGSGVTINFNDSSFVSRTPAEMEQVIRDQLVPALARLKRKGAFI